VLTFVSFHCNQRNGSGWLVAAEIEERLGNEGLRNLLLRRGIECSPTDVELYRALGNSLVSRGKISEAREVFEKGIEVDPHHAPLYHALAELEARVFNIDGLSKLNKRAAKFFNNNALEPPPASSETWGAKIRAGRSAVVPKGVTALAQRIVEEDENDRVLEDTNPTSFLDRMSSSLMEEGLVGELLRMDTSTDGEVKSVE
jgi:tetratricopeptide (TPR) repeat protein